MTRNNPAVKGAKLTEREQQVIDLLAEGMPKKLIADEIGLSEHTIKFHVTNILRKFDSTTTLEAVVKYIRGASIGPMKPCPYCNLDRTAGTLATS